MKKFLVLPMPIHHHLSNIFQNYLIQRIRVGLYFIKQTKITRVAPLRSENSDFLMKFKIVDEVKLGSYTDTETSYTYTLLASIIIDYYEPFGYPILKAHKTNCIKAYIVSENTCYGRWVFNNIFNWIIGCFLFKYF